MSHFKNNLERMDFVENGSLLFVSDLESKKKDLSPAEVFALDDAKKFEATAVYFRHFQDGRSPVPQIYIYDDTGGDLDEKKIAEIHRDMWSYCKIPMFIVVDKTDVKIFDARQPVKILDASVTSGLFVDEILNNPIETNPIETLKISSEALKLYSRKLFDSGIFWESDKAKGKFLESTSAYNDLITNLKKVRKDFLSDTTLPPKTANKLLVFSILIKYLEERGNENERLFAHDFFQKLGAENFCGVLRQKGKIVVLFEELSRHFNGRIFEWANEAEKKCVKNANLTQLAYFFDGNSNLESGQMFFDWRKYSFNHLPVELISSVYEELLNERDDAVYTPEFLVNMLIDESMPQKDFENLSVKTIDVSCGSGIFLVSAFKRLAQRHRYAEFKETGDLKPLKSTELLKIIKDNIFGIDIEEDAVRLTVFSLCLALCDELSPKEIWTELQFDNTFDTNFKTQNFFEYTENEGNFGKFDLVIGNPPFISLSKDKNGNYFKDENDKYYGKYRVETSEGKLEQKKMYVNEDINFNGKNQIYPDNQTALMFLDQSPVLLNKNGLLCLIMPAAPLLYNNSFEFKKHFFPKHQVYQILDFTNLDSVLFEADVPTAAIFVRKIKHNEEKPITHVTIQRTKSIEDKIFFEIDKYDFHYVSQQYSINDKHIWKCNLLGGGRLHNLISRLANHKTIENYIGEKDWLSGEGYIVKGNRKLVSADYITEKLMLPGIALDDNGINKSKLKIEKAEEFLYPRTKELFSPPLVVIKENIGRSKIPVDFSKDYLPFKSTIIGISASQSKNKSDLSEFFNNFKKYNSLFRSFISATSNQYLVTRGTLLYKQDIMNLPYPDDKSEMQLSFVEQILCDDVLEYYIQLKSKSNNAKMNNSAKANDLKKFGEVFSKMLNSVYGKFDKSFFLKRIYDLKNFYITEFNYGAETSEELTVEKSSEPTEHIKALIESSYSSNVSLIRVLKLYERNKVYLIKPKTLRYWLRSIAIKDADEAFSDLLNAGY